VTATTPFDDYRGRAQAALFGSLPAHIDRLGWDADRLVSWQRDRIRVLLAVAMERSPFHARRLDGLDPAAFELEQLPSVPVMTKAAMMAEFDDVVTDRRASRASAEAAIAATTTTVPQPIAGELLVLASGGSSGRRGLFVFDPEAFAELGASILRPMLARLQAAGAPPTGRRITAMVAAASPIHATGVAPCVLAGSPIEFVAVPVTQPLGEIVRALNHLRPDALFGYPSMLALLAHEQASGRLQITPTAITSNSETLRPHQRERIRQAFGVPIVDVFGSSEGLVGTSAPDERALTFASDCCITELVDDDDRPVPAGTMGTAVLVTNLFNHVQPLIRYRLEDRFVRQPNPGSGHLHALVDGRASDLIEVGGRTVHALTISSPLTARAEVVDFHLMATGEGVHVEVVAPGGADGPALRAEIVASMEAAGVERPVVTLDVVESLHRLADTGKVAARAR
jgi:phenylacetate-coenzyme A ligase PaaK-like adenylate-forming protein